MSNGLTGTIRIVASIVALSLWLLSVAQADAPAVADEPRALVAGLAERLVDEAAVRGEALRRDPAFAYALTDELVAPHVDFPTIARRVLGRHGREAKPEQLDRFAREYQVFIVRTLVAAFLENLERVRRYGQRVTYLPTRWGADRATADVRARLALDSGVPLEVEFRLHRVGDAWRVYDVGVAGVSLVQANQAAFARELQSSGLDGLSQRLAALNRSGQAAAAP